MNPSRRKPSDTRVYQLRIALADIRPEIWRRVQVPAGVSLRKLHDVLQAAMGWTNSHLHRFEADGREWGRTDPELDPEDDLIPDQKATLAEIAPSAGSRFEYESDFGDGWEHSVVVEDVRKAGAAAERAICLDGARACPPEDCGGPYGYEEEFLAALRDPDHDRHTELLEWIGGGFEPEAFDLDAANRRLKRIKL